MFILLQSGAIEVHIPGFKTVFENTLLGREVAVLIDGFDRVDFGIVLYGELGGGALPAHRYSKDPSRAFVFPHGNSYRSRWVRRLD